MILLLHNLYFSISAFQYSYDKYMSEFPRAPGSPSNSSQVELLSQFAESNSHQTLEELQLQSATGFGAGLVCLCAETLVGYPFIVLRRQCQVGVISAERSVLSYLVVFELSKSQNYIPIAVLSNDITTKKH